MSPGEAEAEVGLLFALYRQNLLESGQLEAEPLHLELCDDLLN